VEIKKVAIIGPECTGKSELSKYLATELNTVWVNEYARQYIENLDRPYVPEDLLAIAEGQLELEDRMAAKANQLLICDTNLYVISIWSNFKYGYVDPWIQQQIASRKYDLYLLTYVDIPWEDDPQREHPDRREYLYSLYLKEMRTQTVPFIEIKGDRDRRRSVAKNSVEKLFGRRKQE
jgi:NadR type nicotinamide-nucleotide adenylyltransferase